MDFKQIEAFISVAKFKSFSKAADAIFLSQPTISSHISSLEKELNIQLFDRSSKQVLLTSAGNLFLEYATEIISSRDKAISNLAYFNKNISGNLNIVANTTACNSILPYLVKNFSNIYHDVCFNILKLNSEDAVKSILNFNSELGFLSSYINHDKISCYKLIEDDLVLISSTKANLPDKISIVDLSKYKFISREKDSSTRRLFENTLRNYDVKVPFNINYEVNNLDTLLQFVKADLGISIVSKLSIQSFIDQHTLKASIIEDLPLKHYIYLIASSKRTLTPVGQAFFDICRENFKF